MRALALAVIIAPLMGCVTTNPALLNTLAAAGPIPVTAECSGDPQCKEQWERAQFWVAKHSAMKVQTATEVLVTTFNPVNHEPVYGFTITREPLGGGKYRTTLQYACGNLFGCSPKPIDIERAFYLYVVSGKDALDGIRTGSGIR